MMTSPRMMKAGIKAAGSGIALPSPVSEDGSGLCCSLYASSRAGLLLPGQCILEGKQFPEKKHMRPDER